MKSAKKITVLLADDHEVVRQGLRGLLERDAECVVIGQARNGREAVALAASLQADVILMDMAMPVLNGLSATQQIMAADQGARVVILSAHSETVHVERALAAGAVGFLEKQTSAIILLRAIREVVAGRNFLSPAIRQRLAQTRQLSRERAGPAHPGQVELTPRESEVLQLVAEGQGNKQIAVVLHISIKTVAKHRQQVMDKLNLHETAGLTRYAMVHGIIENRVHVTSS